MLTKFRQTSIQIPWTILCAIAGSLFFTHIALDIQRQSFGHLSLSLLFWVAVGTVIAERRPQLKLETESLSLGVGSIILVGLLITVLLKPTHSRLLGLYPFIASVGLALISSGIRQIRQYQQEIISLLLFALPQFISAHTFNISPITARVSAFWLWRAGFPVQLNGINITLPPRGGVNVVAECSGLNLMLYMFGVAIVFLMLFPTSRRNRIILPILAVGLGFLLNSIRVSWLAYLNASVNQLAFEYWHSEEGALFSVLLSVGLFGLLCWLILGLKISNSR